MAHVYTDLWYLGSRELPGRGVDSRCSVCYSMGNPSVLITRGRHGCHIVVGRRTFRPRRSTVPAYSSARCTSWTLGLARERLGEHTSTTTYPRSQSMLHHIPLLLGREMLIKRTRCWVAWQATARILWHGRRRRAAIRHVTVRLHLRLLDCGVVGVSLRHLARLVGCAALLHQQHDREGKVNEVSRCSWLALVEGIHPGIGCGGVGDLQDEHRDAEEGRVVCHG